MPSNKKTSVKLLASCGDTRAKGNKGQVVEADEEFAEFLVANKLAVISSPSPDEKSSGKKAQASGAGKESPSPDDSK